MKAWLIFFASLALSLTAVAGLASQFGLVPLDTWSHIASGLAADQILGLCLLLALALALASFVASLATGDHSWVDRLWSLAPVLMVWLYAAGSGFRPGLVLPALIVSLWGGRLTWNFARKGGYAGEEDYRWGILRSRIRSPWLWQLFNLLFICGTQIGLFVAFTLPGWILAASPDPAPGPWALLAAGLMLAAIVLEGLADAQQWDFHQAKRAFRAGQPVPARHAADVEQGFLTRGLFAFSRHPNYFGELMVWWFFYLYAVLVTGQWFNLALGGPVLLSLLFAGSTRFTEEITAGKYPAYRDYQQQTSAVIPWLARNPERQAKQEP